jgi:hypothetical protein
VLRRGVFLPASAEIEIGPDVGGDYALTLLRGEADAAAQNTLVGIARLPSHQTRALAGGRAIATVAVDAEGTLSVTVRNPLTGRFEQVALSLG